MLVDEYEFRIRLALTGEVFMVPADKSIVEVLRENGIDIETCCEQGYCGTCMTRYLEGEPEHRDEVLDDEDREHYVLVCCADPGPRSWCWTCEAESASRPTRIATAS